MQLNYSSDEIKLITSDYSKKFKDAEKVEKQIHNHFSEFRIKKNKEVFKVKLEKIIEYIDSIK